MPPNLATFLLATACCCPRNFGNLFGLEELLAWEGDWESGKHFTGCKLPSLTLLFSYTIILF